ncbi:BRCT domain-containing protein [Streptomyces sp. WI04-05B]|uniref:BRCT domain-containing protein n=1 Tax=Streptomyces TaxID=1883 RepID=UPI0029B4A495|nr:MULTISPECIES: BRCT domain-containing protein [unclassified Streptomyces]MDX2540633.1 BRCT domain-containing protein [Streptomyces sp. WI04-05B]MDX2584935.1 BRCT domain-containing protein [Streptomyces sp. WI04-05A]
MRQKRGIMDGRLCDGWVRSLRGQTLCFTGKVLIDGEWTIRKHCIEIALRLGAGWKPDFSRKITVVVHGDLASQVVTDARREYSQKLVRAAWERDRGYHVCVVDADGFADLLGRFPARCRELRQAESGSDRVLVLPQTGDGILGGPLRRRSVGQHEAGALALDLDQLDKGTRAHEATVTALVEHLARQQIELRGHARHAPRFDAGWSRGDDVFIAEVKSLTGASEAQQIRLGIGQVLDYAHQLQRVRTFGQIRPVLVLEKQPDDPRWRSLAEASGILLTWAPLFAGC